MVRLAKHVKSKKVKGKSLIFIFAFLLLPFSFISAFAQVPTCVTALAANPQGPFPCSARLDWVDNSTNETQFIIERQLNGGAWTPLPAVAANITFLVDASLVQDPVVDNKYCYRVFAANLDASGKQQRSAAAAPLSPGSDCKLIPKKAAVVVPIAPPNAPSGFTTSAVGQTVIRASWSDNSDNETGYEIERWTSKPAITTVMFSVPADTVNWDNTGLVKGRTYCYRVRAKGSAGDSAYSNQSCGTTNR